MKFHILNAAELKATKNGEEIRKKKVGNSSD